MTGGVMRPPNPTRLAAARRATVTPPPQEPDRVRALLVTPSRKVLLFRRERGDTSPYWVFPGGGVEPSDQDHEGALQRELVEEVGSAATIHSLMATARVGNAMHLIYLATITTWITRGGAGPEFRTADRGGYQLHEVAFQRLGSLALKPGPVARWLTGHDLDSLFNLPDLREHPLPDLRARTLAHSLTVSSPEHSPR